MLCNLGTDVTDVTVILNILTSIHEESPDSLLNQGFSEKNGSLLLSRIALQYHRRKRA